MAKKGAKREAPLHPPPVSDAEVASARLALQDAAEKRRQNSNMHYYLQSIGKRNAYEQMTSAEKKEFFVKWFAKKVADGTSVASSVQTVSIVTEKAADYTWMGKEQMINLLGEHKATSKIASGAMEHRPDPDTKNDGEWDREYKVYCGSGKVVERSENKHSLDTSTELKGEALAEGMEDMSAATSHVAGEKPVCTVVVKTEPVDGVPAARKAAAEEGVQSKTYEALCKNPRAVLRNCGDTIVTIKTMFATTQEMKYAEALHEDITKLLPKFRSHYTNLEKMVTNSSTDEAMLLAIAVKLDAEYSKFNIYADWYQKLCGSKSAKRSSKT